MGKYFAEQNPKLPFGLDLYAESATALAALGTTITLADGRKYVYAKNGAAAVSIANLMTGVVPSVAHHTNVSVQATTAIKSTAVPITIGATAVTVNQYAEGYLQINAPAGASSGGYFYKIKDHALHAGTGTLTLNLYDETRLALTATTSKATLVQHPCANFVVEVITTGVSFPLGVTIMPMTALYYGWLQVKGPCSVLVNGTLAVGGAVVPDTTAVGGVMANAEAIYIGAEIGTCITISATTTYGVINLSIPGF